MRAGRGKLRIRSLPEVNGEKTFAKNFKIPETRIRTLEVFSGRRTLASMISETQPTNDWKSLSKQAFQTFYRSANPHTKNSRKSLAQTTQNSGVRETELLVDLGGASLTVHFFDGAGNQRSVVKSKVLLANSSCAECQALRKEGLEKGWIKERSPPDHAEIGYTFVDYSDRSTYPWEEVSSYLSRVIRAACRHISLSNPSANTARVTVLQTGKIRKISDGSVNEWEQLMRTQLQKAFASASTPVVAFPSPPQHALLSNSDEAYFEGLMMFKYQNLSMIDINAEFRGPSLERDNALALSIGSSSTQIYTLDANDGSLISRANAQLGVFPSSCESLELFSDCAPRFKTGAQFANDFERLLEGGLTQGKTFLLLVNAIGYVMKEVPALAELISRQEPIPKEKFCRESRLWLQSMRRSRHRRWDLDLELYHQLQLLSGLVESLERDRHVQYIIVEKKGHLKPNGLQLLGARGKLDYHWVTAVHKYGLSSAASATSHRRGKPMDFLHPVYLRFMRNW
eukprot:CAMPEP_0184489034 /NCGR_PEP_ID=MMETSP0113_2-20130426/14221_1 /TAXON_ID=91329 /ORGANISM="Norrisiella sphaerica, Strain BC52" /LENGTH=511 /DNA_ID=CAMNT_0026872219 /DNA_START=549 /DNA_END=2081 /DNA_ORIENTATION=-